MMTPTTNIHQPMSARPVVQPIPSARSGAIYQAGAVRPLFEDRRARLTGDTLTINLVEKTSASKKSSANASKTGTVDSTLTNIAGLPGKFLTGINASLDGSNTFAGKGDAAAKNDFTGTITVTVIEVYTNGNLLVSGEKQISLNQGQEYIRFSGVVNPSYVTAANTVQSTQVADARMEYKANGYIDEAQTMGWLQRFFLSFLPF